MLPPTPRPSVFPSVGSGFTVNPDRPCELLFGLEKSTHPVDDPATVTDQRASIIWGPLVGDARLVACCVFAFREERGAVVAL
jgi:hypothetical protein